MFPASSDGNTNTLALPATGLDGDFRAATDGTSDAGIRLPLRDQPMRELESRLVFGMDRFETRPQRGIRQHRVIGDENRNRHPGAIHLAGGGEYPLVPAFRKDYPALEISRALADAIDEPHFGNFFANAFATAGCTRPFRFPWCLATSRTTLVLM